MDEFVRSSGVLLHITSLPSRFGIGDLGPAAYGFIDRAAETGLSYWQVLPLNPTVLQLGSSPYHSPSGFAGNVQFISPELLMEAGWVSEIDLENAPDFPVDRTDYSAVYSWKQRLFDIAFRHFRNTAPLSPEFEEFLEIHSSWLEDYALFRALKDKYPQTSWQNWPEPLRDRNPSACEKMRKENELAILRTYFLQFLFFEQWERLRKYSQKKGVRIIGDLPIYVTYESVDVWREPEIFQLDALKRPTHVAGVPPDYFSATGQLWGNPLYRWEVLKDRNFDWWLQRFQQTLSLFDLVRIDHFRGFVGYWQVPAGHKTARQGRWVKTPADGFFSSLKRRFPEFPFIAEDLGVITPDVVNMMQRYHLPGMKVLLFAFGENDPQHPYLPPNYPRHCVAYTGTHDTNTTRGWFENEAGAKTRTRIFRYLKHEVTKENISWEFVRQVLGSQASLAIIPMQDFLGLGQEARMNRPGRKRGNWMWRMSPDAFNAKLAKEIAGILRNSSRAQSQPTCVG